MSSKNSNQINVPEARQAMNDLKQEVANELGISPPRTPATSAETWSRKCAPYEPQATPVPA